MNGFLAFLMGIGAGVVAIGVGWAICRIGEAKQRAPDDKPSAQ